MQHIWEAPLGSINAAFSVDRKETALAFDQDKERAAAPETMDPEELAEIA